MAKKTKAKRPYLNRKSKEPEQYAAINYELRHSERTWFPTAEEAAQEALDLMQSKVNYPNYKPPAKMVVVKVIEVVEAKVKFVRSGKKHR